MRFAFTLARPPERIVAATGLRGLASADLLVDGADWWLTEINPRPGATLDVLDRRGTPLLAAHIAAEQREMAVATQAVGTILIFEKMFENRLFFVDKLVSMGYQPIGDSTADMKRAIQADRAKWKKVIEATGIRAE